MNFLSPVSLLALIPVGAVIVLLYLLKLKRREHTVSSVMLWKDAVADIQANAPFQKLKKNLLLLLQLLIALALVLAIARPYMRTKGMAENKVVVIIDSSASMQATDVKGSRFDAAKSNALEIVRRMGPGDSMLVMTAGSKSRVAAPFTSDKRALGTVISGLQPSDSFCNMRQAMLLSLSLIAGKSSTPPRIVVFSDGGFPELSDLSITNAKIDFIRVGRRSDNVAITGLSSRKTLSGEQQVFIGLRNFSDRQRKFNMELYHKDRLIDIREESLAPNSIKEEILGGVKGLDGRITAKLDIADDLKVDNSGSVYLSKPRGISVLLVSDGNVFLQNALNLDPRVQLTKTEVVPELEYGQYDLVVFDKVAAPKSLPKGGYLLVDTSAAQGPSSLGTRSERPSVIASKRNHPVTSYVDFNKVAISEAASLQPKEWATALVEADNGTILAAGSRDGRRFVQIAFDLLESDFPLRVGFPIFIANCLDWLVPSNSGSPGESIRAGRPIYIDVPPSVTSLTIEKPDHQTQTVKVTQTPVIYDDTERTGIYRASGKGFTKEFSSNLCSSEESSIAPKSSVIIGNKKAATRASTVDTNREFYGLLAFLALAVLMFEWYVYHRRL